MKYAKKILSKFSSGFIVFVKVLTITTKNGINIKDNEKVDGKKSSKEGLTELAQGSFGFDYVCNVGDGGASELPAALIIAENTLGITPVPQQYNNVTSIMRARSTST